MGILEIGILMSVVRLHLILEVNVAKHIHKQETWCMLLPDIRGVHG